MSELKLKQVKSAIGGTHRQRESLKSLGLRRIGDTSVMPDRPEIRGMVNTVAHLIEVEETDK